jgi:hypothetical protein
VTGRNNQFWKCRLADHEQCRSALSLDKPSLGLAPLLIERLFERLVTIKQETGLAIILVEQNFRMTVKVATRCISSVTGPLSVVAPRTAFIMLSGTGRLIAVDWPAAPRPLHRARENGKGIGGKVEIFDSRS